jgi:uncharacterized protein (DUF58 family)
VRRPRFITHDLWASPLWKRLDAILSGGVRQRITTLGYIFAAIIIIVGLAAFLSANNLLFLILALLLAVFLVSGFVSRMGLAGLELELSLPEHLTARQETRARAQVRNTKPWMPSFSIRLQSTEVNAFPVDLYFPVIPGASAIGDSIPVCFPRRGSYRENSFQFQTRFPFGFTERRIRVPLRGEVIVYPSIAPQPAFENLLDQMEGEMSAKRKGHGTDFHRVRPYEYGENIRHIDWKSTAHTGKLQIREFTSHDNRSAEIFLDLTMRVTPEFAAWFERAVECAAFLVWHLTRQEVQVQFRTQEVAYLTPGDVDCYAILKYLATVEPLGRGTPAPAPDDESHVHVALTAHPEKWSHSEWHCPELPELPQPEPAAAKH